MRAQRLLSLLIALSPIASCAAPHPPHREVLPTAKVQVEAAAESVEQVGDEIAGTVRARNVAYLAASVMGTVRAVNVAVGDRVRIGQPLVRLSAGEIAAKAAQAEAGLARAKADLQRAERLKASQAIPEAQHEAAISAYRVAEAALREAHAVRDYLVIRAPFAGVVTTKDCNPGDLAQPGRALLVVESPGALRLEAYVPEADAHLLSLGQSLPVRIDALGATLTGTVSELGPTADPASRSVLAKLDLPPTAGLRTGMFARLLLARGTERALEVPAQALVRRGQLELLYVVDAGKARLRLVRAGRARAGRVEILAGLSPGELVITQPAGLLDGQSVEQKP